MSTTDLTALIGSRICHDLVSPLGAIGNGLELLTMSGMAAAPELALIAESVENANARIRFFRIAFGAASKTATVSQSDCVGILRDMYRDTRLRVDWRVSGDVPRGEAKLAFLLIQCLESAIPFGGRISITRTDDCWHLTASGDRLKLDEGLWETVKDADKVNGIIASEVQFALAPHAARNAGRTIGVKFDEQRITISF